MTPPRRTARLAPGSGALVAYVLLLLALTGVLAVQAIAAAAAEARSTERELRGYAAGAGYQLSVRAEDALAARLAAAAARALPADTPQALPALAARASGAMAACGCPGALRGVFAVDGTDARVTGDLPALALWLRSARLAASTGDASRPLPLDEGDTARILSAVVGGRRLLLVYRADGAARLRGFAVDLARAARPALAEVVAGAPLLPPSLQGRRANADALAIQVAGPDGRPFFQAGVAGAAANAPWLDAKVGFGPGAALGPGEVSERLDGLLAGLGARVAVRRALAGGAASGAPRSRLPLLAALFFLALGLSSAAVVQLRRQQELARLRDDFVSGVSHELRTPLAQIRLFADLLESGRLAEGEARARSVRIINEEARRLSYLVENILHFSRAQRGAGQVSPDPVEVAPLLAEIVDAFAPLARSRGVVFVTRLEEGVVARIDRDALRQVMLNLLDNAVKYGPRGQTVTVGMEMGIALRIWVDDQGPGVPAEARARIWEPYRRLDRNAEQAAGGSGIGLAVVRDLVALHGGRGFVQNAPGGGARFGIELFGAVYAGPPGSEEALVESEVEAGPVVEAR